jgi:Mce-associated membrane protein
LVSWVSTIGALGLGIAFCVALLAITELVARYGAPFDPRWWICVCAGAVAATAFNRLVLAVVNGQSLGRAVSWRDRDAAQQRRPRTAGAAARPGALAAQRYRRAVWLLPSRDACRCGFADSPVSTTLPVLPTRQPDGDLRPWTTAVSNGLAGQHDRSITEARTQISCETTQGNFERARSRAAAKYRAEPHTRPVAAQQASPLPNQYRVTNSAVLTAAPSQATMLWFSPVSGGAMPDQRRPTASMPVTFLKPRGSVWRVEVLAFVTTPQTTRAKS